MIATTRMFGSPPPPPGVSRVKNKIPQIGFKNKKKEKSPPCFGAPPPPPPPYP